MVNLQQLFGGCYKDKRVLVTGHTGFKGSWLSLWLYHLGAHVSGFSKYIPTTPSHFEVINLEKRLDHHVGDIRNLDQLREVFKKVNPHIVFHLAAQPIVRDSYKDPKLTFDTNLGGTVNVLECLRESDDVQAAVLITSDKCYENIGIDIGYKEDDRLGGADPYSASKACAEIAISAYYRSFLTDNAKARIASTRAGNVIGGGDWANDRIVPDCFKSWKDKKTVTIRKPDATRPWQHVLEPLSGYLWLGASLVNKPEGIVGEAFNFGPDSNVVKSVGELTDYFTMCWNDFKWEIVPDEGAMKEANLLKLSFEKANEKLNWSPLLSFDETMSMTADWYKRYFENEEGMYDYSCQQIVEYVKKAENKKQRWSLEGAGAK